MSNDDTWLIWHGKPSVFEQHSASNRTKKDIKMFLIASFIAILHKDTVQIKQNVHFHLYFVLSIALLLSQRWCQRDMFFLMLRSALAANCSCEVLFMFNKTVGAPATPPAPHPIHSTWNLEAVLSSSPSSSQTIIWSEGLELHPVTWFSEDMSCIST